MDMQVPAAPEQKKSNFPEEALNALLQKDYARAADLYQKILRIDPSQPAFWCNLSIALRHSGHREAALGCARRAAELGATQPDFLANISDCLLTLDRMEEALDILKKIVAQAQDNVLYRRKYASAFRQSGKFEEALAQSALARKMVPDDVETNWEYAVMQLSIGNLTAGWDGLELRWKRGRLKEKPIKVPRWTGEDLTGKSILVHEEQGFGDTILASRYIPLVKQRGARVIFQCRPELHKLFKSVPGIDRLPLEGPLGEPFQYHAPLFSLPAVFGTDLNSIPPPAPLSPAEKLPPEAAKLLAAGKGRFKVGIVWSGNPNFADNYKRAVPFLRFMPLMEIRGVQFYSLQKGAAEKELAAAGASGLILELGPHMKDFADTAAIIKELDLVIMTDSSVAHAAGSMGKPIWNLLDYSPFWLYMRDRSDSPWYPSMRLFRQPRPGDWDSVFKDVAEALRKVSA